MGQPVATLEAQLRLDTSGLAGDGTRAVGIIDKTAASAIAALNKIDAAMAQAGDMSGPVAEAAAYARAVLQAASVTTVSARQIEAAGDKTIANYQRQTAAIGKTTDQLRAMRAEQQAVAAESDTGGNNTDLANRIREAAAAYAAAKEAAEAEAAAVRDAAAAHQMFEAAARAGMAALRDQEAAAERLKAALDPIGAAQARANAEIAQADQLFAAGLLTMDQWIAAEARVKAQLDATTASIEKQAQAAEQANSVQLRPAGAATATAGTGDFIGAGSAQASAAAIKELMDAEDQLAARVKALTAAVDPQAAALARANALVAEARELDDGTAAAATRLAQAEKLAADASKGHSSALGLNSTQMMIAEGAAHRYFDSLAAGMSPMRAFILQAGDLGNILAMDDKGVAGGLEKVKALINPFTVGLALGTAALLAAGAAALGYANALDRMSAIAQGSGAVIGATGADLEAIAEKAAAAGNVSVAASREIVSGYVQAGGIGKDVLGGLVDLTENFAKSTGQDAAGAQHELAAAFQDPVKGAEDLTTRYGSLTQAQIEHIRQLVDANDKYGAQAALLAALGPQFDGAAEHANVLAQAWHGIEVAASNAWTSMGRAIALALGGGSEVDQLADLQQRRAMLLASNANGLVGEVDQQIAALKAKMAQEQAAAKAQDNVRGANSVVQVGMSIAGASTGAAEVDTLKTKLGQLNAALATMKARGQDGSAAYGQLTTAQQQYQHAVDTYLPTADRAAKAAALDAQAEATKDPVQKRALATQKSLIDQSGQLITGAQAQAKATADGAKAYQQAQNTINSAADAAAKKAANHAAELARSAAAEEAQIDGLGALARAYAASGAAALIAEATEKANVKAIKDRGAAEAEVSRQIRLSIAQRVADAAKSTAAMNQQTDAQNKVNAEVEAGLIPQARAAQAVQEQIALLPQLATQEAARQIGDKVGYANATAQIEAQTKALRDNAAAKATAQFDSATKTGNDQLAELREELSLVGQTDAARVHALATLRATQQAETMIAQGLDPAKAAAYVQQQVALADGQQTLKQGQDDYNASLGHTADMWSLIAENMQQAASDAADSLGSWGKAIGGVAQSYTDLQARQSQLDRDRTAALKNETAGSQAYAQVQQEYATKGALLQIKAYGDMAASAQSFFKKGSTGYKALGDAEKAFRAIELALAIKSAAEQIGLIGTHVAAKVTGDAAMAASDTARSGIEQANSVASTAKSAVEAVVNAIKSLPFPANIAAGAATLAAVTALGVAVTGGFGGGGGYHPVTNTGTGTVFGDDKAQSESIKNSIDALKDVDTTMLSTSREMLTALKSIDSEIGQLTNTVIAAGNIGTMLGVSNSSGGLFGTSKKVVGTGINGGGQTFAQIDAKGYYGADYYADTEKTSNFLGIKTGSSISSSYKDTGQQLEQQFGKILDGFASTVEAAAGPLGVATDTVEKRLQGFVVDIGRIDLTGLSGDDIQKKLQAVFSAEGDKIGEAVLPGLEKYQQAGEGYLQTLTRVVSTIETVSSELDKLGTSTANLSIDAKMGIAGQFDSLSDFTSAADAYFSTYYTDAEQAAAKTAQLGKVFDSLGVAVPATDADFRKLVEAQDLTTTSGQQTYATLLQIAPAFADLQQSMEGAKSAADILSEQQDLQKQLWEAEGNTANLRAAELATIDPSNRALQQRIYDLQDEQAATDAASKVAQERAGIESQLLQLEGDANTIRQQQLDGLDASNRALQQQVFALQDQQAAATAAAQAQQAADQAAAAVAQERTGLETQLLQLQGDTATQRERELAALDPTNRAIQQQIYDLTDLQAAQAAAAQSAQQAAEAEAAVAQERAGIQQQLWQAEGDTASIRAAELAGLDASNRALMQQVYALQDQQAAAEAAAQAEAAVAQERDGLMQQLWQLTGNTAAIRQAQLASLDPSNRALQEQIYAISDAQDAAKAAEDLASAWTTVGDSIEDEVKRIRGLTDATTSTSGFVALQGQFNAAVAAAKAGDQDAAKGLPDLSKALLDAAATAATSRQELARIEAQTAAALDGVYAGINAATTASNAATAAVMGAATDPSVSSSSWWSTFAGGDPVASSEPAPAANDDIISELRQLRTEVAGMRADNNAGHANTGGWVQRIARIFLAVTTKSGGNAISTVAADDDAEAA